MSDSSPSSAEALAALAVWMDDFADHRAQRGQTYFKAQRVRSLEQEGKTVRAIVRGSFDYATELKWAHDGWQSNCTCPMEADCKHTYALGLAWLRRFDRHSQPVPLATALAGRTTPPAAPPKLHPEDVAVVAEFTAATGRPPAAKELSWLRNLHRVFVSTKNFGNAYAYHWFDYQALQSLAPQTHRYLVMNAGPNLFTDLWKTPPASPLKLWSFLALLFHELKVPLPDFTTSFTDVAAARASRTALQHEKQLAAWRERFAALDRAVTLNTSETAATPATLRVKLGPKKLTWEISSHGPTGPFKPCPADELRDALNEYAIATVSFDDGSNILLSALRKNFRSTGRTTLRLNDSADIALIGTWLGHPVARQHVVGPTGDVLKEDPRTVTWRFDDHPTDPKLTQVTLVLSDGTPLPTEALFLPGSTSAIYLTPDAFYRGLPPADNSSESVAIPREILALPEAGRFAIRAGLKLPGDTANRFRSEPLQARFRITIQQSGNYFSEVLKVVLHAVNAEGAARARWDNGTWNTQAEDIANAADAAFLLHDFSMLQAGTQFLGQFPELRWIYNLSGYITALGESVVEKLGAWLAGVPSGVLVELAPELAGLARPPTRGHFTLEATESGIDWFDVQVTLRVEDTTLTDAEIALLRKANGRFIRLEGKGWRRLQLDLSDADRARFERLGLDPAQVADEERESPRFHALQLADETLGDALPEKLWRQIRERAAAIRQVPAPVLPAGLQAELRPYQLEGYHYLAHLAENRFGGVLADDMGLGKTLQALTWLLWLASRNQPDVRNTNKFAEPGAADTQPDFVRNTNKSVGAPKPFRALVICPKSVVFNWETETARFAPALTTARLAPRASNIVPAGVHLVVANYAQLRLNAEALAGESWDAVILDEGQNIKNPTSATAQAARALRASHRLVLTGTPIENRLLDLWSLFAFAQPGLLGGQTQFKRLYNDKTDPTARSRLATRVRHFMLRRTKNQVARELPPRSEEDIIVELDGSQRALYDAELKRARAMLLKVGTARDFDAARFNILQSLLRLRQICCDPRLLGADLAAEKPARKKKTGATDIVEVAPQISASAKLEALLDTLEPVLAEGHRVLVFSQFVTMLELIRAELSAREIKFLMLTGQTENRQELVAQFQAADGPPVFLLSLKAAGSGLNLTAASYVVLYDPWWNPAVEAQAIDRTHRIGQKEHVIAYRLIARNTIEEKIRALQKEKAALAASVIQEESLAQVLDLASLRQILG